MSDESDDADDADEVDDVDELDDGHDGGRPADGPNDDGGANDGASHLGEGLRDGDSPVGEEPSDGDRLADDLISEFDAPDGDLEDLFTEMASDDIDTQSVWAELDSSGHPDDVHAPDADDHIEEPVDDAVRGEGPGDEAVVSKASYCQRCEYFSSPPDVGCSNPGTEIIELVDVEHFRVRDCPVVAQRRGATVSSLDRDDGYGSTDGDDGTGGDGAPQDVSDSGAPDEDDDRPGDGEPPHGEDESERTDHRDTREDRAGSADGSSERVEGGDRDAAR